MRIIVFVGIWCHTTSSASAFCVPPLSIPISIPNRLATNMGTESRYCRTRRYFSLRIGRQENQETAPDDEYSNMERYRNRATLLEATLKLKMQEIKDTQEKLIFEQSKAQLLQDVTKRLQRRQQEKDESVEKERNREQQQMQNDMESATSRVQELEQHLEKMRSELDTQTKEHNGALQNLEMKMEAERKKIEKQKRLQKKQEQELLEKMGAIQNEMLHLDETLENTQDEAQKLRRLVVQKEDEMRDASRAERRKRKLLKEALATALQDKEKALQQNNTTATTPTTTSSLDEEDERSRLESIEIAKAAVQAAERRELSLQGKLEGIQSQYNDVLSEKEQLQDELVDLKETSKTVADRFVEDMQATSVSEKGSLVEQLRKMEKENYGFRQQMEGLQNSLRSERLSNAVNRKADQKHFDELVEADRVHYETKIKNLRSDVLDRNLEDASRDSPDSQSGNIPNNNASWTSTQRENVDVSPRKRSSGLWKKIRSPRSWFSRRNKVSNSSE